MNRDLVVDDNEDTVSYMAESENQEAEENFIPHTNDDDDDDDVDVKLAVTEAEELDYLREENQDLREQVMMLRGEVEDLENEYNCLNNEYILLHDKFQLQKADAKTVSDHIDKIREQFKREEQTVSDESHCRCRSRCCLCP